MVQHVDGLYLARRRVDRLRGKGKRGQAENPESSEYAEHLTHPNFLLALRPRARRSFEARTRGVAKAATKLC
jgi:hypothetical protein